MERRQLLGGAAAICAAAVTSPSRAATTPTAELRVYIPGGAGGGWDQTGRALGAAMTDASIAQRVEYENKGGKGGILGLADFVERYGTNPNALLIGGLVMVGSIALHRPAVTLANVTPLARLTSDYMVLVTRPDSPLKSARDMATAMQRKLDDVVFTGGSVGGVDHMLAAMVARQLRLDVSAIRYLPTSSGAEALAALTEGKAQVAISSYSEFKDAIEKQGVMPIATSSRRALFGVPSLYDQGIYTELANWRGVFGPSSITPAQKLALQQMVLRATESALWRRKLQDNRWVAAVASGKDFSDQLEIEQAMAAAVTMMLKLKT